METPGAYTTKNDGGGGMVDLRLSGTLPQLEQWQRLLQELEKHGLATVYEVSKPYPNRGSSKLYRSYIKCELRIDFNQELFNQLPPDE